MKSPGCVLALWLLMMQGKSLGTRRELTTSRRPCCPLSIDQRTTFSSLLCVTENRATYRKRRQPWILFMPPGPRIRIAVRTVLVSLLVTNTFSQPVRSVAQARWFLTYCVLKILGGLQSRDSVHVLVMISNIATSQNSHRVDCLMCRFWGQYSVGTCFFLMFKLRICIYWTERVYMNCTYINFRNMWCFPNALNQTQSLVHQFECHTTCCSVAASVFSTPQSVHHFMYMDNRLTSMQHS